MTVYYNIKNEPNYAMFNAFHSDDAAPATKYMLTSQFASKEG